MACGPFILAANPAPPVRLAEFWPAWVALLVTLLATTLLPRLADRLWRHLRGRRADVPGVCAACGYSTRGLPGPICPECGANVNVVGRTRPTHATLWLRRGARASAVLLWAAAVAAVNDNHARRIDVWLDENAPFLAYRSGQLKRVLVVPDPLSRDDQEAWDCLAILESFDGPMISPVTNHVRITDRATLKRGEPVPVAGASVLEIQFPSGRWTARDAAGNTFEGERFDPAAAQLWTLRCKSLNRPNVTAHQLYAFLCERVVHPEGTKALPEPFTMSDSLRYIKDSTGPPWREYQPYPLVTQTSVRLTALSAIWLAGSGLIVAIGRRPAPRKNRPFSA